MRNVGIIILLIIIIIIMNELVKYYIWERSMFAVAEQLKRCTHRHTQSSSTSKRGEEKKYSAVSKVPQHDTRSLYIRSIWHLAHPNL